jgi:outer membrane murein-binding lipoprotein Lpp
MRNYMFVLAVIGVSLIVAGCSGAQVAKPDAQQSAAQPRDAASAEATPSRKFTSADIAKLKWIEGTWKGTDADKPFYERYKVEETALVVETLKADGSVDGEPGRFELKDGEFGKDEGDQRSVASEITADYIQFVPAPGGRTNSFRFERQANNTWRAVLEWPAKGNKPAGQKIYIMEPWKP